MVGVVRSYKAAALGRNALDGREGHPADFSSGRETHDTGLRFAKDGILQQYAACQRPESGMIAAEIRRRSLREGI